MLSFEFSGEQEELRRSVRQFAEREIRPKIAWMVENQSYDPDLVEKMKRLYVGLWFPREYGGKGGSLVDMCIVHEEIARVHSTSVLIVEGCGLGGNVIAAGGTEEQKRKWIPRMSSGEMWCAFAMTDEGPGSDPASMASTAKRTKGGYLLNGKKRFISNCDIATHIVTFAKTDPAKGAKGISAFLVDRRNGPKMKRLFGWGGVEHKVYELEFKDLFVPEENLIGREGEGFRTAMRVMDGTRVCLAAANLGKAEAALDMAVAYAKERVVFGKPLKEYQAISFPIAEMAAEIEAGRWLTYHAAWLGDRGEKHTKEASMAKLFCVDLAGRAAEHLLKVMGGKGWMKDYPVGRMFVDSKMAQYGQGSLEIQKLVVAREILGK